MIFDWSVIDRQNLMIDRLPLKKMNANVNANADLPHERERERERRKNVIHWFIESTVELRFTGPRFTGPRFAGEPRFTGQEPADQTFHYISLRQKPRFTGDKTPILGIFSQKSGKMSWFSA